MSCYIKLYYGYEESSYGIRHTFITKDIADNTEADKIGEELADSLGCLPDNYDFDFDSTLIPIPDEVVERIKADAVLEYRKHQLERRLYELEEERRETINDAKP